jgi:hypothetical protein
MIDEVRQKKEDDWFRQNERQLLEAAREAREKREKERAERERAQELERLKQAHYMKCPKCGHDMSEVDLCGVPVDRCGHCEGIFLDAGELEQLYLNKDADQRHSFIRRLLQI